MINNLMLYDYVQYRNESREINTKVYLIEDNEKSFGRCYCLFDNELCDVDIKSLYPIQLSIELLKNNGWYYVNSTDKFVNDNCSKVTIKAYGKTLYWRFEDKDIIQLQYVHELQNLLRLLGYYNEANNLRV